LPRRDVCYDGAPPMPRHPALLALTLFACAARARPPARVLPDDGRFVVRFAPHTAGPSYDVESLRAQIARLPASAFSVTLRADAVARYVSDLPPAGCVVIHLTAEGAARLREDAALQQRDSPAARRLAVDLDGAVFVVELDGRRLYEGQVWPAMGAAAFDTAAMHPDDAPAPGRLILAPSQGMWSRLGPGARSPIDQRALRDYFAERGVFEESVRCAER
jgi:hypothetical protein